MPPRWSPWLRALVWAAVSAPAVVFVWLAATDGFTFTNLGAAPDLAGRSSFEEPSDAALPPDPDSRGVAVAPFAPEKEAAAEAELSARGAASRESRPAEWSYLVRVDVAGERRLPDGLVWDALGGTARVVETDARGATVRIAFRPRTPDVRAGLHARATEHPPAFAALPPPRRGDGDGGEVRLSFELGGRVDVHVVPPADDGYDVSLNRCDDDDLPVGFRYLARATSTTKRPAGRTRSFAGLRPGRYRPCDAPSGVVGDVVVVEAGKTASATLDLSQAGTLRGRVADLDPDTAVATSVVAASADRSRPVALSAKVLVRRDGSFEARLPGDRPMRLRVDHPVLAPAPDTGEATVTAPTERARLRLVRGAEATFRLARAPDEDARPPFAGTVDVEVRRGGPEGAVVVRRRLRIDDPKAPLRFGGFLPGTYDVEIDVAPAAPLILRDVACGEGTTDLGTLTPPAGATLRVALRGLRPSDARRLIVNVDCDDGLRRHWRRGSPDASGACAVFGVGRGRCRVHVEGENRSTLASLDVPSEGVGEIALTIDLP